MENGKKALYISLKALRLMGYNTDELKLWDKFITIVGIGIVTFVYVLIILGFVLEPSNVNMIVKKTESFMNYSQVVVKIFILWSYRREFNSILNLKESFWSVNEIPETERKPLLFILNLVMPICRFYQAMTVVNVAIFLGKPILLSNFDLPFVCWIPNMFYLDFKTIYTIQIIGGFYSTPLMFGFDIFFAILCSLVVIQFKILNYKFRNVKFGRDSFKNIHDHHNFLISFVKKLRKVYSLLFVCQIVITTLTICMELYLLSLSKSIIGYAVKDVVFCITLICQFIFYCVPATEVSIQATELTDAIYDSPWYGSDPKMGKYVLLILIRAQQKIAFTAGGMHEVNRETLTKVFKTSISFYAMLKTIQEK